MASGNADTPEPGTGAGPDSEGHHDPPAGDSAGGGQPGALKPGDLVGRCVVVATVGEGGMGVVYAAYDPELDRKVAIKVLRAEHRDDNARARHMREAQAMARLSHPNVIPVYDVGTLGDDVFLSMELVEGETLHEWEIRKARSWREVVGRYVEAGKGLAAAHRAGLVHRDFKPKNVIIGTDGRTRVLDFGLARSVEGLQRLEISVDAPTLAIDPAGGSDSDLTPLDMQLTRTGALVGTPVFMAPEQYQSGKVDARSDLFGFCVALYRALYGELPFEGATMVELAARVVDGRVRPAPPDARVPRWLRQVVIRGLAADPADRYPSVDELLEALGRDPARTRRRWLAGAAAVIAVAVAVVSVWLVTRHDRALCSGAERKLAGIWDEGRRQAIRQGFQRTGAAYAEDAARGVERVLDAYARDWTAAWEDACAATHLTGEQSADLLDLRMLCLAGRLAEVEALVGLFVEADEQVVRQSVEASFGLRRVEDCADLGALMKRDRPPVDPGQRAAVEGLQGRLAEVRALLASGRWGEGVDKGAAAAESAARLGYQPLAAEAWQVYGRLLSDSGRFEEAQDALYRAVAAALAGHSDDLVVDGARELAWVVGFQLAQHTIGHHWAAIAEAVLGPAADAAARGRLKHTVGAVYYAEGQYARARESFAEALLLREQELGPDHVDVARTLNSLGVVANDTGDQDEAMTCHLRALEIRRRQLGRLHPLVAESLNSLGNVYAELGQPEEAEARFAEAIDIWESTIGLDNHQAAGAINNLAIAAKDQERYDEAVRRYGEAAEIFKRLVGEEHPWVAMTLTNIGEVQALQGELDQALGSYRQALAIDEKVLGPEHPDVAYDLNGLGRVYLDMGQPGKAIPLLERALRLREASEVTAFQLAEVRFPLARALWDAGGDRGRAAELANAARQSYVEAGAKGEAALDEVKAWLDSRRQ